MRDLLVLRSLPVLIWINLSILELRWILLNKLLLACRNWVLNLVVRIYIYLWLLLKLIIIGLLRSESSWRIPTLLLLIIRKLLRIAVLIYLLLGSILVLILWAPGLWVTLILFFLTIILIFWCFWKLLTSCWATSCL